MSFISFRETFQHRHILIFGFGILGGGKAVLEVFQQFPCEIIITDKKTEEQLNESLKLIRDTNLSKTRFGEHNQADIDWADIIIKNPAVPSSHPLIQYALQQKKWVTTEAALFLKFTDTKTIGITGTRGKTTTTLLTHHLLSTDTTQQVLLGGNIRDIGSLALLLRETPQTISVLELSSFALEGCHWEKVSPSYGAITNIFPDHLDRYHSVEQYAQEKAAIFLYQKSSDQLFLNAQNDWTPTFQKQAHSQVTLVQPNQEVIQTLRLKGEHNQWNAAFAVTIAQSVGVEESVIKHALTSFIGAPFRQQMVGQHHGRTFINDSTSTTPEALLVALQTFPHACFIIGGATKNLPLQKLVPIIESYQGNILLLQGSGSDELQQKLTKKLSVFENLQKAFYFAVHSQYNEIVFSPGFTSFELFKNEFDRAEQFNQLVEEYNKS